MGEVIRTGLELTLLGMGLVFLLLALLWGVMVLLLRLDQSPAAGSVVGVQPDARTVPSGPDPEILAAITVAVLAHRSVRRKQAAPAMRTHWPGTLPSRWIVSGRTRQNQSWQPRRR